MNIRNRITKLEKVSGAASENICACQGGSEWFQISYDPPELKTFENCLKCKKPVSNPELVGKVFDSIQKAYEH